MGWGGGGEVYRVTALTLMTLARASAPLLERLQPVRLMELMEVWFLIPLQRTTKGKKISDQEQKQWHTVKLCFNNKSASFLSGSISHFFISIVFFPLESVLSLFLIKIDNGSNFHGSIVFCFHAYLFSIIHNIKIIRLKWQISMGLIISCFRAYLHYSYYNSFKIIIKITVSIYNMGFVSALHSLTFYYQHNCYHNDLLKDFFHLNMKRQLYWCMWKSSFLMLHFKLHVFRLVLNIIKYFQLFIKSYEWLLDKCKIKIRFYSLNLHKLFL